MRINTFYVNPITQEYGTIFLLQKPSPTKQLKMKTAQKPAPSKTASKGAKQQKPAAKAAKPVQAKMQQPSDDSEHVAKGLRGLFVDSLKDIYWAEKALTKALPKMIKKASSEELVAALNDHLAVTQEQVARLDEVFESIGVKAQAKKCEAMDGLIKEADQIMAETEEGVVRDAGIIAGGQKIEHYEIATYGTLSAFAKILQEDDAAELLMQSLEEEKEADDKLSEVAETSINIKAAEQDDDDEEDEDEEDDAVDVDEEAEEEE